MPTTKSMTDEEFKAYEKGFRDGRQKENPSLRTDSAAVDDVSDLIPKARSHEEIWAKFNGDAVAHARSRTKAGSAN